jgi:hypothetical protein
MIALSGSPYSCHKPTAREEYPDAIRCHAALEANLKIVPEARFRQIRLDPDAVDLASQENMNGAFDLGRQLGMTPDAVQKDLHRALDTYVKGHSWQPTGGGSRKFIALGHDFNECLLDYFGRPNE